MPLRYFFALFAACLLAASAPPAAAQNIAVRADTLYTMAGDPVTDGVVLIRDGAIERVGPAAEVDIPSEYETYEATVVTPGFIDAHATVGLSGLLNQPGDQDQLDTSDPIQPSLRAIDAYNPRDPLVEFVRNLGVTTVHTGHGPGALISGQTTIFKTAGTTIAETVVDSVAMLAMTLGPEVGRYFDSPGTRAKAASMLREKLLAAQSYREKQGSDDAPERDLAMEALSQMLSGEVPALLTAQKATEIQTALRLAEEFGFRLVLDGAAESYLLTDAIKAAGVSVVVHPPMMRAGGSAVNAAMDTPAKLHAEGIPIAFQSGYEAYVPKTRIVPFEAAIAVAYGMPRQAALEDLTLDAARLLGIENRVGSLEEGKDADLVLFDGDPFEYTTHACTVIIDGAVVSDECV